MSKELQTNKIQVPEILVEKFTKLGITNDEASSLMETFGVPLTEVGAILDSYQNIVVTDESQKELMAEAKEKRLTLKRIRTGVDNTRKSMKDEFLRKGNAIQAVANYIKEQIEPAEEYLELQEKFAELKEAERAAQLFNDRVSSLYRYTDDLSIYQLQGMSQPRFDALEASLKAQHEAKLAEAQRIEDERIAAEKAREAEIEAQFLENAKLKAEAEARDKAEAEAEKARQIERDKAEAEQAKRDAAAKLERDKLQAAYDKKLAEEKAAREKLEQEARDKAANEARIKAEADEAERQALLAPDKDKLIQFAIAMGVVKSTKLPAVKSNNAQAIVNSIDKKLSELIDNINTAVKGL